MFSEFKSNMKKLIDFKAEDTRFKTEKGQDFVEKDNSSVRSFNGSQFQSFRKGVQRLLSFKKKSPGSSPLASRSTSNTLHQPETSSSSINQSDLPKQQINSEMDQTRGSKSTGYYGRSRPNTPPSANVKRTYTFPQSSVPSTSITNQEEEGEQESNLEVEQQKKNITPVCEVRNSFFDIKRTLPEANISLSGRHEGIHSEMDKKAHSRQLHQAVPFLELNQSEFKEKQNDVDLKLRAGNSGRPIPPPRRNQASLNSSNTMAKPHTNTADLKDLEIFSSLCQYSKLQHNTCKDTKIPRLNYLLPPTYNTVDEDDIVKDMKERLTISSPPTNSQEYQKIKQTENPATVNRNRQKSEVTEAPFIKEQVPNVPPLLRNKQKLSEQSGRGEIEVPKDENLQVEAINHDVAINTEENLTCQNEFGHYAITAEPPGNRLQRKTQYPPTQYNRYECFRTDSDISNRDPSYNPGGDIMTKKRKDGPSTDTNQRKRTTPLEMPGSSLQIGQTIVLQPICQQLPLTELLYRDVEQTNDNKNSPNMTSFTSLYQDSCSAVIPSISNNSEEEVVSNQQNEQQDAPESSHQQHHKRADSELNENFVKTTLERINNTMNEVRELEEEMRSFPGTNTNDQDYLYLDEVMMRSLIKLDNIETRNDQELRNERKEGIRYIQHMMARLEQKLQENQKNMKSNLKSCSSDPASSIFSTEEHSPENASGGTSDDEDVGRKCGNVSGRHEKVLVEHESLARENENLQAKEKHARKGDECEQKGYENPRREEEHQRKAIEHTRRGNRYVRKEGEYERRTNEHTPKGDEHERKGEERVPKTENNSPRYQENQSRTDDNTSEDSSQGDLSQI